MRRTPWFPLLLVALTLGLGAASALARPVSLEPATGPPVPLRPAASLLYETYYFGGTTWAADSMRWEAVLDSVWTFETGVGSHFQHTDPYKNPTLHAAMEGWTGVVTARDQKFRRISVADFGQNPPCVGSPAGLGGDYSFWAGLLEGEDGVCWAGGQGYGDNWGICIEKTIPYGDEGCLLLAFSYVLETEEGYDYVYTYIDTTGSTPVEDAPLAWSRTGTSSGVQTLNLIEGETLRSDAGPVRILFCVRSDGGYSDEDGLSPTTCGAFAIDDLVLDNTGCGGALADTSDFETGDDGWQTIDPFGAEDYSHLAAVQDLPAPLVTPCDLGDSVLVMFDPDGGPNRYHPLRQDNLVLSPWIDLRRADLVGYSNSFVELGGYFYLYLLDEVFLDVHVQWYPDTCSQTGKVRVSDVESDPFIYFGSNFSACSPDPVLRVDFGDVLPPHAEQVRIGLSVFNYCRFFSHCTGNTNTTPWFDNVRFGISTLADIQTAIDAAAEGDTIWIPPGTYRDDGNVNLDFGGKNLVLKSQGGPEATIIDGEFFDRCFVFQSGEDTTSVVEGFTLRRGRDLFAGQILDGGAVLIAGGSSPVFRDCVFEDGRAISGGAVYADSTSAPHFVDCTFRGCIAEENGGALFAPFAVVSRCTFEDNQAELVGGGANLGPGSFVENSLFTGNEAGEGGGLRISGGLVLGSTVSGNHSLTNGGGVSLFSGDLGETPVPGRLEYTDITDNTADGLGGGVFQLGWTSVTGGAIAGNTAVRGGGVAGVGWFDPGPGLELPPGLAELSFVVLTGNQADEGGGVYIMDLPYVGFDAGMALTSCTVSGNSADTGGGIRVGPDTQASPGFHNRVDCEQTILFGNCGVLGRELAFADTSGLADFTCSNLDTLGIEGPGTFVLDGPQVLEYPEFCSPAPCYLAPTAAGRFELAASSPDLPPHNACGVLIGALGVGCQIVDAPPGEEEAPPVATPALAVGQNPFRGSLSIRYEAPEGTDPVLRIYDVRGALVRDLPLAGPRGSATWDGRGRSGESSPAGVYFLQLVAGSERRSLRVVRMQ